MLFFNKDNFTFKIFKFSSKIENNKNVIVLLDE